jgi:hypothetical protein
MAVRVRRSVVLADGEVVTASATSCPDLLWAISGGGGSFGIVVRFVFRTCVLPRSCYGGHVTFPYAGMDAVVTAYNACCARAPRNLTLHLLCKHEGGEKVLIVIVAFLGLREDAERLLTPLLKCGAVRVELHEATYSELVDRNVHVSREAHLGHYWRTLQCKDVSLALDLRCMHVVCDALPPRCCLQVELMGGAYSDLPDGHSAVPYRRSPFLVGIMGRFAPSSAAERAEAVAWVRAAAETLALFTDRPVCNGNSGSDSPEAVWGDKAAVLRATKRRFDPTNFFHRNTNVPPA